MTSFSKQTQRPEEQPQRRTLQGGSSFSPANDQMRQMQNARSHVPATPTNPVENLQIPQSSQVQLSPNPARQNYGGSQGSGTKSMSNGLGLLQRSNQTMRTLPAPEIEGNNLILYRAQHFFLRTAYRPGQTVAPFRRPTGRTTTIPKIMPQQGDRIASSETHMLPMLAPINPVNKKGRIPIPKWLEAIIIVIGLIAGGVAHTLNMFNFPRYALDEGTYMSSALAILHGQLWPYAYGYGHPPVAWMQIALWVQLSGGFFTFGNAINSGRVLMLLYSLGCMLLVYLIVRRFGGSRSAGLLAMLILAFSPLSVWYQRQVLLDNIATFWLLISLYLLVVGNSRLIYIVLAAVTFGISILSKEVMILFIPGMIYAVWLHTTQFQRKFAIVAFTYSLLAVASAFVLMAVLKGELFPPGWLPWDHNPHHLSLLGTFANQTQRTQNEGSFAQSFFYWWYGDNLLIAGGILSIAFNLLMGWWNRKQLLLALLAICFWILLLRGGVVLDFYLIPLIPLMAINIAMAVHTISNWIGGVVHFDVVRVVLILGVLAVIVPYDLSHTRIIYTQHPTSAQSQAITWVRQHVPHNDFIVINSYLYMELREPRGVGVGEGATYPYAHMYQNVATDPVIKGTLLGNNADNIDYIIADSGMLTDIHTQPAIYGILATALKSSVVVAQFSTPDENADIVITVYEVKHKNAPPVVNTVPSRSGSSTNLASVVRDTMPINRRLYIG
ncbi:MAG: hypothetical protein NVS2B2_20800 [Ktedonobacteraceae bacterium]